MKKILFLLVLMAFKGHSQTVQYDSGQQMNYAEIQPISIGWTKNNYAVSRIYVRSVNTTTANATVMFYLEYPIDTTDVNFGIVAQASITVALDNSMTVAQNSVGIFQYLSAYVLNVTYK